MSEIFCPADTTLDVTFTTRGWNAHCCMHTLTRATTTARGRWPPRPRLLLARGRGFINFPEANRRSDAPPTGGFWVGCHRLANLLSAEFFPPPPPADRLPRARDRDAPTKRHGYLSVCCCVCKHRIGRTRVPLSLTLSPLHWLLCAAIALSTVLPTRPPTITSRY